MIYGIGTDITKISRFQKWIDDEEIINRFFNPLEIKKNGSNQSRLEHYAARFAAKEAFSKALGTGITGFNLKDVYIENDENGKPFMKLCGKAEKLLSEKIENAVIHVSLSHEKEYATAFVIIEG